MPRRLGLVEEWVEFIGCYCFTWNLTYSSDRWIEINDQGIINKKNCNSNTIQIISNMTCLFFFIKSSVYISFIYTFNMWLSWSLVTCKKKNPAECWTSYSFRKTNLNLKSIFILWMSFSVRTITLQIVFPLGKGLHVERY